MRYMQRYTPGDPVSNTTTNTPFADGGSISHLGPFRIHTFSQDDANTASMWQSRHGDGTVYNFTTSMTVHQGGLMDILVVGGGGGGSCMGGGGGAGGYLYYPNITVTAGQKIIQVGGGGGSEFSHDGFGQTAGGPSFFADMIAVGGGAGAGYSYPAPGYAKFSGGSGGGAGQSPRPANPIPAGTGTPGQGHPGGNGWHGSQHAGGGGGGAAQPGWPANPSIPYNGFNPNGPGRWLDLYPPLSSYGAFPVQQKGGNGLANDVTGFSQHYAGGGGGGGHPGHANNRTAGGLGGGGDGTSVGVANSTPVTEDTFHLGGQPGQRNTGGGGGGSTHSSHQNADGGRGGPGVVIVRYRAR